MDGIRPQVLYGVTGSIAAVKAPEIVRLLVDAGYDVRCLLTPSAQEFVSPMVLSTFSGKPVLSDVFGSESYQMPHIQLANQADLLLLAPVTATILARCAYGLAEDMVTLAYITTKAPVVMAPAMHTTMWEHPATQENVRILKARGVTFAGPFIGPLADNTHGEGRMEEPKELVRVVSALLSKKTKK